MSSFGPWNDLKSVIIRVSHSFLMICGDFVGAKVDKHLVKTGGRFGAFGLTKSEKNEVGHRQEKQR